MSGSNSISDAKTIVKENCIFQSGEKGNGPLTSQIFLENVPYQLKMDAIVELNKEKTLKTLGVLWKPTPDYFSFKVKIKQQTK
jgi:hypothetical protein